MKQHLAYILLLAVLLTGCKATNTATGTEVYSTKKLIITRISNNVYEHTSYLNTGQFGKVPCNGMVVINGNEAVVFDTPATDKSATELIAWTTKQHVTIKAVIPTHFHDDCLGGLAAFHKQGIASYASERTITLAKADSRGLTIPQYNFKDSLSLSVGDKEVTAVFFGEGHTRDNVVGYFAPDNVMFGGCLIKELSGTKGNLTDANVNEWTKTVEKVKAAYPDVKVVIPGHGRIGDKSLLDYTGNLFSKL